MQNKIVVPGELISTTEEFTPGEGTYEENGKVLSANLGIIEIDNNERVIKVKAINPVVILKEGDIVIGTINDVRGDIAIVEVSKVVNKKRSISSNTIGTIHISRISSNYISDIGRELRIGDILRARVVQIIPLLQLSIQEENLGVLRSLCMKCRNVLKRKNTSLFCENCERIETRKIANDYGEGIL